MIRQDKWLSLFAVFVHFHELLELFVEFGVEFIVFLAFGRGGRTCACGAVLRIVAVCGGVVVVSIESSAAICAAVSARASVVVAVLRSHPS